jgi:DcuC family C4-dicarboxylate transporter
MATAARRPFLARARVISFAVLLVLQMVVQFRPAPVLQTAAGLASFVAWILALSGADKTSVLISSALVLSGAAIFASMGTDPLTALVSFGENAGILMIMVLVPLIGIVIDLGGYADALGEIAEDIRRPAYLYGVALVLAYAIGSVLLNASIALVWTVLAPVATRMGKEPEDILVPSLPRGYNASLLWTPSSPAMAIALALTGATWTSVVKAGFFVSLFALVLAILVETRGPALRGNSRHRMTGGKEDVEPDGVKELDLPGSVTQASTAQGSEVQGSVAQGFVVSRQGRPQDGHAVHNPHATAWRKTAILALGLGSFIAGVVILQELGMSIFQAIIPCILLTLMVWGGLTGHPGEVWKSTGEYFPKRLPRLSNQFLLMTTGGFIGTALQIALKDGLPGVSAGALRPSTLVVTLVGSMLVWAISIAGIHSLIGMTIVHSVIAPFANGVSPAHMSMTLLLGSALGFTISPVSATILVTSAVAGKNSVEVGLRRQWKYAVVAWVICSVVLSLLRI